VSSRFKADGMGVVNTESAQPIVAIHLRAIVLALGESVEPAWWKTEFMNETGFRFLERLFPHSYYRAAVHSAGKAACDVHDQAVGRVGVYHLFRLPDVLEDQIHSSPPSADDSFSMEFRSSLGHPEKLLVILASVCDGETVKKAVSGPIRIGKASDLTAPSALSKVATVYHDAFRRGKPSFPYFEAEHGGVDV
jgi:hypothetical protein